MSYILTITYNICKEDIYFSVDIIHNYCFPKLQQKN